MHRLIKKSCWIVAILFYISSISINVKAAEEYKLGNEDLIITFRDIGVDNNVKNFIVESGGEIVQNLSEIGGIEVKCNPNLIPDIKAYSTVDSISPNSCIKLLSEKTIKLDKSKESIGEADSDLYNIYQWDIKKVTNNGESFNVESGRHDVVVGIIDSGIDRKHPDLQANLLGGKNLVPKNFNGDSTETGDPDAIDDRLGHGTIVAGVIAANGRTKGVAPKIGFKSYRVFDKNANTNASIVSAAIIKAADDGVKVINLSLGGYDVKGKCYWTNPETGIKYKVGDDMAEYSLYKRAIRYAEKKGIVVVTSAGNEGLNCKDRKQLLNYLNKSDASDGFSYEGIVYETPGNIKGVINVSATRKDDKIASYSNYGEKFIDIAAPGGDYANGNISDLCLTTYNGGYIFTQGTSIAAPKVSATAALILCRFENLSPKQVAKEIYRTSEKVEGKNCDEYYGHGLVNAYNALINN